MKCNEMYTSLMWPYKLDGQNIQNTNALQGEILQFSVDGS